MEDNKSAGVPDWNGQVLSGKKKEIFFVPYLTRPHHLRHTFCSRFCENETNLKVIQSIMGHANIETTLDIYAEVTETKKHEAIEKLAYKIDVF